MNELSGLRNENKAWQEAQSSIFCLFCGPSAFALQAWGLVRRTHTCPAFCPQSSSRLPAPFLLCTQSAPFRCGSGTFPRHSPDVFSAPRKPLPECPTCFHYYPYLHPSEWLGSSLAWRLHPVCLEGAQFSPLNLGFCFENKGGNPCSPLSGLQALCCKSWWKCEVTHCCHALILCTELRSKNQPGPTAELLRPGRKSRERVHGCLVAGSNLSPLLTSPP